MLEQKYLIFFSISILMILLLTNFYFQLIPKWGRSHSQWRKVFNYLFCIFYVTLLKTLWKCKNEGYKNKSKWKIKSDNAVLFLKKNRVVRVTRLKDMIMRTRSKIEGYIFWGLRQLANYKCLVWPVLRVTVGGNMWSC